jgi:hypothetical protein
MNKILKILLTIVLMTCFTAGLAACANPTELDKLNKENEGWLNSADSAMLGFKLSLRDDMTWGMTREEVTRIISGPFENDYVTYISTWIPAALPSAGSWNIDPKSVNPDAFTETELLSYYTFSEDSKLVEYGYQYFTASLVQYDFLKEYYSKKYGEPQNEEYIWNDESYEPDGTEDLYAMFDEGLVKVMTVWDIDELKSVIVVDWLNDPAKEENDFGQISFYEKTGELTVR